MKLSKQLARGAGSGLVKWVLGLLFLGAAGLYAAERWFDPTDSEEATARARADSVATARRVDSIIAVWRDRESVLLSTIVTLKETQKDLRVQRDGLTVERRNLRRDLSNAATQIDTIRLYVETIQVLDSTVKTCGLEVETCLQAQARLDSLYRGERQAHDSTKAELDTLRTVTVKLVEVTNDCKNGQANLLLFKFCKPSQTVSFLVGAAVGATLSCWATSCLSNPDPVTTVIYRPTPPEPPREPRPPNPKDP